MNFECIWLHEKALNADESDTIGDGEIVEFFNISKFKFLTTFWNLKKIPSSQMSLAYGKCATRKQGDGNKLFIYRFSSFFSSRERAKCLHADNVAWNEEEKNMFFFIYVKDIVVRFTRIYEQIIIMATTVGEKWWRQWLLSFNRWGGKGIHCVFYELEMNFMKI